MEERAVSSGSSVVLLSGPTASGKTALAVALARVLDAEIVSVDSALVYRGLDIGTAKPTELERAGVPHHLIDIREPWEAYSAAAFVDDALSAIAEIRSRGRLPLLAGGTLLYVRALERGLAPLPPADAGVREALAAEAASRGWPALHAELARVDPSSAARIHPNDPQRLQRALEVHRLTGTALGELQRRTVSSLDGPLVKLALVPDSRAWLHARIARRLEAMLAAGFLEEVRALRAHRRVSAALPAMRSVGYRQAWEHLERTEGPVGATGRETESVPTVLERAWVERACAATRQLAKRQLTWLRGMDGLATVSCDTLSLDAQAAACLEHLQTFGIRPP